MRKFGLIGYPLTHSFSPGYFAQKFAALDIRDATYELYPLPTIEQFPILMQADVIGVNVTIPYKEQVIPYLDQLSTEAEAIGAVNVIHYYQGLLTGYNSDAYGFQAALEPLWARRKKPKSALVLGTGGAAKAVCYVLRKLDIDYQLVSRTHGDLTYEELHVDTIQDHHLIINTTPLGMAPHVDASPPIPYEGLTGDHFCFDLVYNPSETLFLTKAATYGATIKNGYQMLELQADRAWEIWNQ